MHDVFFIKFLLSIRIVFTIDKITLVKLCTDVNYVLFAL